MTLRDHFYVVIFAMVLMAFSAGVGYVLHMAVHKPHEAEEFNQCIRKHHDAQKCFTLYQEERL